MTNQQVWTFAEADYRFGVGPLRMTVERIDWANPLQQDDEIWYEVDGLELTETGQIIGPRRTAVKASRLPGRRQHP
jgi:hypothetical protein